MEMIRPLFLFEGMSLGEISSRLTDISHKTDGGMKEVLTKSIEIRNA